MVLLCLTDTSLYIYISVKHFELASIKILISYTELSNWFNVAN